MKSKEYNVLIIDASTDNLYVIVSKKGNIFGGKTCDCLKKHSQSILVETDRVLKESSLSVDDIDVFACGIGCGSFTGLRVAISTVKGLNARLNKKMAEINTLQTIAFDRTGLVDAVMDAGGGRFYHAKFCDGRQVEEPRVILEVQLQEMEKGSCVYFDKEMDLTKNLVGLTFEKIEKGDFVGDLTPLYLRKCQAEELRDMGKL